MVFQNFLKSQQKVSKASILKKSQHGEPKSQHVLTKVSISGSPALHDKILVIMLIKDARGLHILLDVVVAVSKY
jgi:hypothetical protein